MVEYRAFLDTKLALAPVAGIEVPMSAVNAMLYPFQRQLVQWALRKGRSAIFADCGLGKTLMQLEWARLTGERTLIVAPLAVAQQTVGEAAKLGLTLDYVRSQSHVKAQLSITNYEMVDAFDASAFGAVVLDESSILKSFEGKTRTKLIEMFAGTKYRMCCTATPAPNDLTEFANHAAFLGICSREEMLAQFFVHDDEGWRMKGYAEQPFYRWLASWAMMLKKPSDIGFDDAGYILPPLDIQPVVVDGDAKAVAEAMGQLFMTGLKGITGRSAARRGTVDARVLSAAKILNASDEQWVVWCGLNDEGRSLARVVPDAVLVEGTDSLEQKVDAIGRFLSGAVRIIISKTKIMGWGLNLQRCHNVMFLGLSDSYEAYYQAVRRCWRFGQESPVKVYIVTSDVELPVLENVQRKEAQAEEVSTRMVEHVAGYEQEELGAVKVNRNGYHTEDRSGAGWKMLLGDCVERLAEIPHESVDFSVFSPPFINLYTYSDSPRDMGNSRDMGDFFLHFNLFAHNLIMAVKPGRNVACHVAQVPAKLVSDGYIGLKDFRGRVIETFDRSGWVYHGEVVIDKDPQAQAIRTHAKGLLFTQLRKDASWLRPGLADYILLFRKPGENAVAIHPDISNDEWIEWARPIWYGIRESDTLNVAEARTEQDDKHIAPLQLGTIERCVRLWSNPGETVLSPFAGIGSEGYQALLAKRRFIGIELKKEYFEVACTNLDRAVTKLTQGNLL